ncbi:hypothetical protein ACWEQ4_03840 [Rhodococcus sp. NPDC003994]
MSSEVQSPETNEAPVTLFGTKKCFVASPIGAAGSDERKRSDLVKKYVIDEALNPLGYETVRADEIEKSGEITTQIVSDLIEADLLIADLTGQNANVFYELAIRHSFRKPYIQIIEMGDELPFDVRAFRTVFLDHKDLESAAKAKETMQNMVREIEGGGDVQSPVTFAVNRQQLEHSQDPGGRELAQISEVVERIEARLRNVDAHQYGRSAAEHFIVRDELMRLLELAIAAPRVLNIDDLSLLKRLGQTDKQIYQLYRAIEPHVVPF